MRDHPHAYGDKKVLLCTFGNFRGSSPRVWGQVNKAFLKGCHLGIIPTRMGTSYFPIVRRISKGDHPHAYGDKLFKFNVFSLYSGSSPRVWGQGNNCKYYQGRTGIIPTRMGTSGCSSRYACCVRDHPHAYGDKMLATVNLPLLSGSSPRVWGQDYSDFFCVIATGIIPTRMGTRGRTISVGA